MAHNTGTIPVEQKQPYDKYEIAHNTGTIPVEQKQPYDKYDLAHNTGTILYLYARLIWRRITINDKHCEPWKLILATTKLKIVS